MDQGRVVAVESSGGVGNCMPAALRTSAAPVVELMKPRQATAAAEAAGDKPEEQQCEHFSIRGYVALVQKEDPKFCSLSRIFHDQKQYDDQHNNSSCSLSVAKFRRWDCSKCLDKVKNSDHRTTPGAVSTKQDVTSDGCSISFIRSTLTPANVGSERLFPCTQHSSQGKNTDRSALSKSWLESNSKCTSHSSGKNGATKENAAPVIKDLQVPSYNYGVTENISNNASVDVMDLPEEPQIRANEEGNGIDQLPCSPDLSEVILKPNQDENGKPQQILVDDCNGASIPEPQEIVVADCNGSSVPESVSGQKCEHVCNGSPLEEAASKKGVEFSCKRKRTKMRAKPAMKTDKIKDKKKKQQTAQVVTSNAKFRGRKPRKVRRISEIINTDQTGGSRTVSDIRIDHEKFADLCEDDRNINPLESEIGTDNVVPVNDHTVGENGSDTIKDKTKHRDDGSPLMSWLKTKKKRTKRKDSGRNDAGSSATNSKSTLDVSASEDMPHDFISSVENLSGRMEFRTTSAQQVDENIQNTNLERNMQKTDDMCKNESENSTKKCLSKVKTSSKRKMHSVANAKHSDENTGNNSQKNTILRTDDPRQSEPENSLQRCLTKASPRNRDIQNVTDIHEQRPPKKRKKQKLDLMHGQETMIDDIPMDVVELMAKNQHERQLMTETDSFDISHTQSKIADDDCIIVAVKDCSKFASTVPNIDFQQKTLATESKQKELHGHVASSAQDTSTRALSLQISDHSKSTQEQQTPLRIEEIVTIAASSPLFAHRSDQHIAEEPTECWGHKEMKKVTWDSFKAATRDSSTETCGAQFRPSFRADDLTSTHVAGASRYYPTHQPVIAPLGHCTERAVNQVQARSFPSTISTMEVGNLCDQRNAGQSVLYPKEHMPATHLLRMIDPSPIAGLPSYETSNRNQMEFQVCNSQYAYNPYKGSTSTSYASNLNGKVPLTLEDLSRNQFQHNVHSIPEKKNDVLRPLRPHARVGVLGCLLQEEISKWSENCGTQSGYRLGVSNGITSYDMSRKENSEVLNSGMFSGKWNPLQLGSVGSSAEFLPARNGIVQSWTRCKEKIAHPLDKFVRQDICVTNKNPADFTAISDRNEYMAYR